MRVQVPLELQYPCGAMVDTASPEGATARYCGFNSHQGYTNRLARPRAGIGRQATLRGWCPKGRVGSTPTEVTRHCQLVEWIKTSDFGSDWGGKPLAGSNPALVTYY